MRELENHEIQRRGNIPADRGQRVILRKATLQSALDR
uniref:Uncharacterized protein n=1 Tax=Anopheles albimanus TaxID=7167 RepID=A0A182FZK2_ANOAL